MTLNASIQIGVFFLLVLLVTKPLGVYMARVFNGERTPLSPALAPVERSTYRLLGVREDEDMTWLRYALAMLAFTVAGVLVTYALLRLQGRLPLNPHGAAAKDMPPDLAFNTAISFSTNTNWQAYVPETAVSILSNMVALAIHNWMSAATGIAAAVAVIRGFSRRSASGLGSFWVDITRCTLYVLAPITLVLALAFVWQGVPQNFGPYTVVHTLEGVRQVIAQGPAASQEAIKMLGTNGGGFFNANSSHPFENPTPFSNLLQLLAIFAIPAGLTATFGRMTARPRDGWAIFAAMSVMFLAGAVTATVAEQRGVPVETRAGIAESPSASQPGGNMEGKETRFGITDSALFATVTTDASCGAVIAMHDSLTPVGGLVPLANILTGEVIFGGVGSGLYGMLMFAVLAVFIAGLMVGRTPEYLGKKIEQYEVKMAMLSVIVAAASILLFAAIAANLRLAPHSALNAVDASSPVQFEGSMWSNALNSGAHGLTEIVYAFTSATGNNGSAFAGITANTPIYNAMLATAMVVGRFLMLIPLLAMAGSLARKKVVPESLGTFRTDSLTFTVLLVSVVVLVGALTYFPAAALGPIVEHLQMAHGRLY